MKKTPFLAVLLFSILIQNSTAQCSNSANAPYSGSYYLGFSTGNNVPFATGGLPAQMTLTTSGDLNINGSAKGYQIGGNYVLWYNANATNIYVGVGAGTLATHNNNTAMGYDALYNNASDANTAIGYYALYNNSSSGGQNTAVGAMALYSNTTAGANTALGWEALYNNNDPGAIYNTATGDNAMYANTSGNNNTADGAGTLSDNISGSFNVAVGCSALAYNTTGSNNVSSGNYALYKNTGGSYNSAIGMWALASNTTASNNTANGYMALVNNTTGANNTAIGNNSLYYNVAANNNTALGYSALQGNTAGTLNVAVGVAGLYNNGAISGNIAIGDSTLYTQGGTSAFNSGNVAIGNSALYINQASGILGGVAQGVYNTATGDWTLRHNTIGARNTANGYLALYSNVNASCNTANGAYALYYNVTGGSNTANGCYALFGNNNGNGSTAIGSYAGYINMGSYNTFVGDSAGYQNLTGYYNTYLGYMAGTVTNSQALHNTTYIGYQAGAGISGTNNAIYMGNGSIQTIYASAAVNGFTSYSDRRIKNTIRENVAGLAFISKIRPVTYHIDLHKEHEIMNGKETKDWEGEYDIEKITESGFIAQQVDSAAQACGYDFNGIKKPESQGGLYALNYTAFVVPLVKAVQELAAKNDTLHDSLRRMSSAIDSLRTAFKNIQTCLNQICAATTGNSETNTGLPASEQNITLSSADAPLLYQNMPNPFSTGTKINYYLPQGTMDAVIVFYDTYGNMLKTAPITQTGNGTLNITPDNMANGIYSYSLIVNGKIADTKRMVLQK